MLVSVWVYGHTTVDNFSVAFFFLGLSLAHFISKNSMNLSLISIDPSSSEKGHLYSYDVLRESGCNWHQLQYEIESFRFNSHLGDSICPFITSFSDPFIRLGVYFEIERKSHSYYNQSAWLKGIIRYEKRVLVQCYRLYIPLPALYIGKKKYKEVLTIPVNPITQVVNALPCFCSL